MIIFWTIMAVITIALPFIGMFLIPKKSSAAFVIGCILVPVGLIGFSISCVRLVIISDLPLLIKLWLLFK